MRSFYDIIWVLIAAGLAISFINSIAIFNINYMSVPADASFTITDVNGTLNQTTYDESSSLTQTFSGFSMLKDLIVNMFYVYGAMINVWHVPPQVAAFLEVIVVMAWVAFLIQFLTRFPWPGTES